MSNIAEVEFQYGSHKVRLETGRVARQATGAVVASMGDSSVLVTVVAEPEARSFGFLPLTVEYEERTYAAGENSGRIFQARGTTIRESDSDMPPDRSPASSAVSERIF